MAGTRGSARTFRCSVAAVAALSLAAVFLAYAQHGRGAVATARSSAQVAVIPGLHPPSYPGFIGIPRLPVGSPQLSAYHFTPLAASQVTAAALASYDTVILYGIRWSDLSASAQQAVNAFAKTGKVLIWDADDTGPQAYSTFIHPFSTRASGEAHEQKHGVVSFPAGNDFLASNDPSSPHYLDPQQLVTDRDMLNDMSAMETGAPRWVPALVAASQSIPEGGWLLAWTYGDIPSRTGMTIYSGMDADVFAKQVTVNYAIKELSLELAARFSHTATASCAPNCSPPPPPPPPHGGGGGSGGGGGGGQTYAACSLQRPAPKQWVHRRVPILLETSVASGITGNVSASLHDALRSKHRVVAAASEQQDGVLRLLVNTRWLRSNRVVRLQALVYVRGQKACTVKFRLKVDNTAPRVLRLRTTTAKHRHVVTVRVSEGSSMRIVGAGAKHGRWVRVRAHRTIHVTLPRRVRHARLILRDRADNRLTRKLTWR